MMAKSATNHWQTSWRGSWELLAVAGYPNQIPNTPHPEIAFWGRSNVGKSSLINNLTIQKNLARRSKNPGRTQELFFFSNPSAAFLLVDMPGYGFARAMKDKTHQWQDTILAYLSSRVNLRLLCLLIDGRHGLKSIDMSAIRLLSDNGIICQIVLTKCDKVPENILAKEKLAIEATIKNFTNCLPTVIATSSHSNLGKGALQTVIATLLG